MPNCSAVTDDMLEQTRGAVWRQPRSIVYSFRSHYSDKRLRNLNATYQHVPKNVTSPQFQQLVKVSLAQWERASSGLIAFRHKEELTWYEEGIHITTCGSRENFKKYKVGGVAYMPRNERWRHRVTLCFAENSIEQDSIKSRHALSHEIGHALGMPHFHDYADIKDSLRNTPLGVLCSVMPYRKKIATAVSHVSGVARYAYAPGPLDQRWLNRFYSQPAAMRFEAGRKCVVQPVDAEAGQYQASLLGPQLNVLRACSNIADEKLEGTVGATWVQPSQIKISFRAAYASEKVNFLKNQYGFVVSNDIDVALRSLTLSALHNWQVVSDGLLHFQEVPYLAADEPGIHVTTCGPKRVFDQLQGGVGEGALIATEFGWLHRALLCFPDHFSATKDSTYKSNLLHHELGHALGMPHFHDYEAIKQLLMASPYGKLCSVMPYPEEIESGQYIHSAAMLPSYAEKPGPQDARWIKLAYQGDAGLVSIDLAQDGGAFLAGRCEVIASDKAVTDIVALSFVLLCFKVTLKDLHVTVMKASVIAASALIMAVACGGEGGPMAAGYVVGGLLAAQGVLSGMRGCRQRVAHLPLSSQLEASGIAHGVERRCSI